MILKTCEHCGANLDPGERCDCQSKRKGDADEGGSSGADHQDLAEADASADAGAS